MQSKLIKAWGPYAVGTLVVDNKEEAAATPGAVRVNPARFAKLQEEGHLAPAEPARPIPAEVRASAGTSGGTKRAHSVDDAPVTLDIPPDTSASTIEEP